MSNIDHNNKYGAFLISRSIFDSDIWYKPAWYLKLFLLCLGKATHKDLSNSKRGEAFFPGGYEQISDYLQLRGGYGKKKMKKWNISKAIRWYRREGIMATRRTTRGLYIKLINYSDYQDLSNYEKQQEKQQQGNSKATVRQLKGSTIHKNEKNVKNEKNGSIYIPDSKKTRKRKRGLGKEMLENKKFIHDLSEQFPSVDVAMQLEMLQDYLLSSGKTYSDYRAFARNWMRRASEKSKSSKKLTNKLELHDSSKYSSILH